MSRLKTDNASLKEKVDLRVDLCSRINGPLRVLDLFAGEGRVWSGVKSVLEVSTYTPVDEAPRQPGTIKFVINSRTVKAFDVSRFNVIDIDTYGEPWEVFGAIAENIKPGSAIFLTYGHSGIGRASLTKYLRAACGIPLDWELPSDKEERKGYGDFSRAA